MHSGAGGSAGSRGRASGSLPEWLLKAKVMAAELPAGYLRREPLLQRLDGFLERRLTVLRAPAGFGKTTVLADIARDARERERVAAWLSLDDDDAPDVFGSYLAFAFEHAGLDAGVLTAQDGWSVSPAMHQVGMLARAIELHAAPCLLVLDEVDRLPRQTVQLLDTLLKRAPGNLHVALAGRSEPGLDVATHLLDGQAVIVDTEAFRFAKADIARFFDGALSRRELAEVEERTAGWPVALMVYRNVRAGEGARFGADLAAFTENYIGVRILQHLAAEDRGFLQDLAVFEWIEPDLVDGVLGSSRPRLRITGLAALDGLLLPADDDRSVLRLHPLVREHCLDLLEAEDLARKSALHERLALALVGRGQLTPAWRHARAAGDRRLLGDLMERFGVFQLWLRDGALQLMAGGRYLTPELTAGHPRLELLRCVHLCLSSKRRKSQALFDAVARRTGGFTRDRDGGDDEALAADALITHAVLAGTAAAPPDGAPGSPLKAAERVLAGDHRSWYLPAAGHMWHCIHFHERAAFEESRRHRLLALEHIPEDLRFGDAFMDIYLGMSAMAQGRAPEAAESYARARRTVRKLFPSNPYLSTVVDLLQMELDLERGQAKTLPRVSLKSLVELNHAWSDIFTAAVGVSAELTFEQHDGRAVVRQLAEMVKVIRADGMTGLARTLAALLADYLVEAGDTGKAAEVWRSYGLPGAESELLDVDRQSWRVMEALSCARIRLLAAQGGHAAAAELASRLCGAAAGRGLTRTRLRATALAMSAAEGAGQAVRAETHLADFLRLSRDAGYVRPLARHREVCRTVLLRLLGRDIDADVRRAAEAMRLRLDAPAFDDTGLFTRRELQVLDEVRQGRRNQEIGKRLGMSLDGVRYHLKNIYRKSGASSRTDAVRYALSLGVLS